MEEQSKSRALLIALLFLWYLSSSLCSLWSYVYLKQTSASDLLQISVMTLSQSLASAFVQKVAATPALRKGDSSARPVPVKVIVGIGMAHFLTTWLMNTAMAFSSIACAQSVRCIEPLLAAFLAWRFLATPTSLDGLFALLTIVIGVLIATSGNGQCDSVAFMIAGFLAAVSNQLRNFLVKFQEGDVSCEHLHKAFLISAGLSSVTVFTFVLSPRQIDFNTTFLSLPLALSSFSFAVYNFASLRVCSAVPLSTHSTLTLIKRPMTIILSAIAGHLPITRHIVLGNFLACSGLFSYSHRDKQRKQDRLMLCLALLCVGVGLAAPSAIMYFARRCVSALQWLQHVKAVPQHKRDVLFAPGPPRRPDPQRPRRMKRI